MKDGAANHAVEREIRPRLWGIGQEELGVFLVEQGDGGLGETLELAGRQLNRLEHIHERTHRSFFGALILDRVVHGSREGPKIELVPLDERLKLPESGFYDVSQDRAQALGVEHAFLRASETLERILDHGHPVDSLNE